MSGGNNEKKYRFNVNMTPEEILAEVERSISKNNPNIGAVQSAFLKQGPRIFKFAIIYQILNANTNQHHHFALSLQSYKHSKSEGWFRQDERKIHLDDDSDVDEIGLLIKFIAEFKQNLPIKPERFGIVKEEDYSKFIDALKKENWVEDVLEDAEAYMEIVKKGNVELLRDVFRWLMESNTSIQIVEKLRKLDVQSLEEISSLSGIAQLKEFEKIWIENEGNSDEEFWQKKFSEFSWSISKLFVYPVILFEEKAYVGGKVISNKKGNVVDFLYRNNLSGDIAIVEIKTPKSRLLSNEYRQTFSVSAELSGGVNQTLKYKHKLLRSYNYLIEDADKNEKFEVFNPKGILIIGNYEKEINDSKRKEAFELFRSGLSDISIVTFDELFKKVDLLLHVLEGR